MGATDGDVPAGGAGTSAIRAAALSSLSRLVLVLDREKSELQPLDLEEGERSRERERERERGREELQARRVSSGGEGIRCLFGPTRLRSRVGRFENFCRGSLVRLSAKSLFVEGEAEPSAN